MAEPYLTNGEHLLGELAHLGLLLHRAIVLWRDQTGGSQQDVFKGLYLSDRDIDRLLEPVNAGPNPTAEALWEAAAAARREVDARTQASLEHGVPLALPQLARLFGLTPFEQRVVVVALAPELDLSYEKFFAYLQDDISRKRPSIDLALRLLCATPQQRMQARLAFLPQAPLFRSGVLCSIDKADGPLLAKPLIVDDLSIRFLLHWGGADKELAAYLRLMVPDRDLRSLRWPDSLKGQLLSVIHDYLRCEASSPRRLLVHFHGPRGTGKKALAGALCREVGVPLLVADLQELVQRSATIEDSLRNLFRQGIVLQAALYLEHLECLLGEDDKSAAGLRSLPRLLDEFSWLTFLSTIKPWVAGGLFRHHTYLSVELPLPDIVTRERLWATLAEDTGLSTANVRWGELASRFRLTPGDMGAALNTARNTALLRGNAAVTTADLYQGCYAQSNQRLGGLARKLTLKRSWADLTLPPNALTQLREMCAQVRYRRTVYEDWGFDRRLSLGKGLCVLFYGPSGVGKTMAVEIIAGELQLEVYKIDLSTVVSKYIGETEKNLSRIFEEAETSNAILFFDEADALFGKRSEVKDAHDRYANIEINYLLQRMEEFEGLAILASNLRKNIDDGFFRRMHFAVEFPMPSVEHRYRIWRQHFPQQAPVAEDIDFDFLAHRFPVAGGNIKNIVLNAAFLAAEDRGEIRMEHLIRATRREYEKIGKLCTEAEFGPYQALLREA